ncbi:MAG: HAMP domain-containing histidine kinase [Saprospiraceae bacterium]|nr:HAMP domain-containing histidine kinase [Saprospiraceae bacterium]
MHHRFSNLNHIVLAGFSLLLLACFLAYYLISAYKTAEDNLNKEVRYIFTNALKSTESRVFDQMIFDLKGISWLNKDSNLNIQIASHRAEKINFDTSAEIKTIINKKGALVIARHESTSAKPAMKVKIELKNDSTDCDTLQDVSLHSFTSNFAEVEKLFKENLKSSGLDVQYSIKKDSSHVNRKNADAYEDVFTNEFYYISTGNNTPVILGNILPDIVLSSLLYLVVICAFVIIIKSAKKQKELYDMKQDFVRNMTHELKTPIATISVAMEAINNFHAGQNELIRKEYYLIVENENKKLNLLVDRVLSVSQHVDTSDCTLVKVNVISLISDVLDSFRLRAVDRGVQLHLLNTNGIAEVKTDQQKLQVILQNLIDNAIKYTKTENASVKVSTALTSNQLTIAVMDNGAPIEEKYVDRIFDKFYRIPHGDKHDEKGHGLGLYIVAQLVRSLNGDFRLITSKNGNNFELNIPVELIP